jgi:hypothetical protein
MMDQPESLNAGCAMIILAAGIVVIVLGVIFLVWFS